MNNNQLIELKNVDYVDFNKEHQLWTEDIENILEKMRINAVNLTEYHRQRYYHHKSFLKFFRLPLIIISAFNSVAAVSLQPYMNQSVISLINCLLSMICGIITSIELYLSIQNNMESELTASKDFYILAIDIFKILNLDRENRVANPRSYLDEKYSQYTKLIETSNLLVERMKDALAPSPPKLFDLDGMTSPLSPFSNNKLDKISDSSNDSSDDDLEKVKITKNNKKEKLYMNINKLRKFSNMKQLCDTSKKEYFYGQFYYQGTLWYIIKNDDNIPYYLNDSNGHSQWDDPRQFGVISYLNEENSKNIKKEQKYKTENNNKNEENITYNIKKKKDLFNDKNITNISTNETTIKTEYDDTFESDED